MQGFFITIQSWRPCTLDVLAHVQGLRSPYIVHETRYCLSSLPWTNGADVSNSIHNDDELISGEFAKN